MKIDEIKRQYSVRIIEALTQKDGSGKGYICPFCNSGSGKSGTGLRELKDKSGNKRPGTYHCFNCKWTGDGLDMIGGLYHLTDVVEQVKKAETLLSIPLLDSSERAAKIDAYTLPEGRFKSTEKTEVKTQDREDKNTVENKDKLKEEIKAEIEAYAANLPTSQSGLSYLQARGISKDTAIKYKLGFCDNYTRDGMNTPAIIIPDGETSFTARSITTNDSKKKVRKRKAGDYQDIFNIGILAAEKLPAVVYIVEGQLDALSIIEAGGQAIATGGGTSATRLKDEFKKYNMLPVFVVLPDNDRLPDGTPDYTKGYLQGKQITQELKNAGITGYFLNTSDPKRWPANIKDANEYLTTDKKAFTDMIRNTAQNIEDKALGRTSGYLQDFIDQAAGATPPISTGFKNLDKALEGGLHPGLIIIGAISSLGKTTFILNITERMAANGQDVLFISLEMSRFELIAKMVSRNTAEYCIKNEFPLNLAKTNLGISDFNRYGNYSRAEMETIQNCFKNFQPAAGNIFIKEGIGNIGTAEIRAFIERHKRTTGRTPVLIVDYVQILAAADARSTDKQNTDRNVVELKRISRDYNTPVIAISSFNRENYTLPVNMAAFKESGAVEYTSDVLLGLQYMGMDYIEGEKANARDERIRKLIKDNKAKAKKGQAVEIQLKILKNRSGSLSDMGFYYYPMFNYYHAAE